jgi:DNA-binding response OmpR family regulator
MCPELQRENSSSATSDHRKKILLVEDDVTLKIIWQQIVKKLDFEVDLDWVTSEGLAQKSIEKKKNEGGSYDLVICDIFLSGNNTGIDLWRTYRDNSIEFIFTSGVSENKFQKLMESENGFHHFLSKPLDPRNCINAINTVLKNKVS